MKSRPNDWVADVVETIGLGREPGTNIGLENRWEQPVDVLVEERQQSEAFYLDVCTTDSFRPAAIVMDDQVIYGR